MMILIDGVKYLGYTPDKEHIFEKLIEKNYKYIFGEDSVYFNLKRKITSGAGIGSIPDAYVMTLGKQPKWFVLEVELSSHPVYRHIIPQLTKFNRGIEDSGSQKKIIELFYNEIKEDEILEAKIRKRIGSGEIYKFISELISHRPTIVIAIDEKTKELEEALMEIRGEVKVLVFKAFRREGVSEEIDAYMFTPMVVRKIEQPPIGETPEVSTRGAVLACGLKLESVYRKKKFVAEVIEGQKIKYDGRVFSSVSKAAVAAIRSTGSPRANENGWTWWKYRDMQTGKLQPIDELRKR